MDILESSQEHSETDVQTETVLTKMFFSSGQFLVFNGVSYL